MAYLLGCLDLSLGGRKAITAKTRLLVRISLPSPR